MISEQRKDRDLTYPLSLSLSLLVNTDIITARGSEKYLAMACNGIDKVDTFVSHKMAPRAV